MAGEDQASEFGLLDVIPLPPAGDRPLLGATVLDGVAVAVVEASAGVLGCVDLADGTVVAEMPTREVSARPVTEALALPQRNPREMKRLVNLFRFYALIVNERRVLVRARSQTEVFAQVARLAALTNRWPHLLGALGAPSPGRGTPHEEGRLIFEDLERAAGEGDDAWDQALASCGLTGGATGRQEPDGLRDFLQAGPRIGPVARELL